MKTKFILIPTSERLPEHGTWIVKDNDGRTLLTRYNDYSTPEYFKENYKYWLLEVPDIEEQLKETIKTAIDTIDKSMNELSVSKQKIEEYQQQINDIRKNEK